MTWGNGHSTRLSWAYEEMEFDWEACSGATGGGPLNFAMTNGYVDLGARSLADLRQA